MILYTLIDLINDATITAKLMDWYRIALGSVLLCFIFGPLWSLVFFRKEKKAA